MPRIFLSALTLLAVLAPQARAQQQDKDVINPAARAVAMAAELPPYDVVSIHQNTSGKEDSSVDTTGDGVVAVNAESREIVEFAYNIASFDLISEVPGPVGAARFDITAKIAAGDGGRPVHLKDQQLQAMLIPLLVERFHLRFHVVPKRMTAYEVVVARGGPKFKLAGPTGKPGSLNASWGRDNTLVFKKCSMSTLAGVLSDSGLGHLIVDRTGLEGNGDFTLKWSSDDAFEQGGRDLLTIFAAMQDQLGLKLEPAKLLIDTLVIDHAEMPTEN